MYENEYQREVVLTSGYKLGLCGNITSSYRMSV